MLLTKEQISEQMRKHAEKKNGLHDLMEIMLESMMVAERGEFLAENPGNKGNGYRPGHSYGQGKKLEFRIPHDRYGNFHPQILAILRDLEEECDRLAGVLYNKGLTQEQVSDVFDQIYGQHYSKSSISRMVECVRAQVNEWLEGSVSSVRDMFFGGICQYKADSFRWYIFQIHPIKEKITENVLLNYFQFINCVLSFQIMRIVFCKTDKLPFHLLCHTSLPKSI